MVTREAAENRTLLPMFQNTTTLCRIVNFGSGTMPTLAWECTGCLRFGGALRSFVVLMVVVTFGLTGCQPIDFYDQSLEQPAPPMMEPPRELSMMSLPEYRIEPPDVLELEVLKLVPLPPYRVEVYDVLQIQVAGTLLDQPINDFYLVEAEGTVNLGPAYGSVRIAGMTIEEAQKVIDTQLKKILRQPEVSVRLARASGTQQITGQYLVGPDGTVNLRQYGSVHVAGKTIADAADAMKKHLSQYFDSPEVAVNVIAYNSKVYYIITQGAGLGDNIVRVPITGKETVLDALTNIGGLSQLSSTKIWIARPSPGGSGCDQILPIEYEAITEGGLTATNYQVFPDDRIYIAEDQLITLTNVLDRMLGPFERVAGAVSLGTSTVRSAQTMGRDYNRTRY